MTAEKRKTLNSVRYTNNPISKPNSEREKGVQVGRTLVVSRGRPNFCRFCKKRHSSLACPVIDPVQTTYGLPAALCIRRFDEKSSYKSPNPPRENKEMQTMQQTATNNHKCRLRGAQAWWPYSWPVLDRLKYTLRHQKGSWTVLGCSYGHDFEVKSESSWLQRHVERMWLWG